MTLEQHPPVNIICSLFRLDKMLQDTEHFLKTHKKEEPKEAQGVKTGVKPRRQVARKSTTSLTKRLPSSDKLSRETEGDSRKLTKDELNNNKYICTVCTSFNTDNKIHLRDHLYEHYGVKKYECGTCSYTSCSYAHMRTHVVTHVEPKKHKKLDTNPETENKIRRMVDWQHRRIEKNKKKEQ